MPALPMLPDYWPLNQAGRLSTKRKPIQTGCRLVKANRRCVDQLRVGILDDLINYMTDYLAKGRYFKPGPINGPRAGLIFYGGIHGRDTPLLAPRW